MSSEESKNNSSTFKGSYTRGYMPHCDTDQVLQSITFRLADSIPRERIEQLELELESKPQRARKTERRKRIEDWLNNNLGCCALGHPEMAQVMQNALLRFHEIRYQLAAWCIMPNHVHVLILQMYSLDKIVQSWKSYTGRWAMAHNKRLGLGITGQNFWMRDYWDRYIRSEIHFLNVVEYIHNNPVNANLCLEQKDWPWSSAFPENADLIRKERNKL